MGGAGGIFPDKITQNEIQNELKRSEDRTKKEAFELEVTDHFSNMLKQYNDRDADKIKNRLDEIKKSIEKDIGDTADLKFGGSVSKHTYVDGLSDIDSLLILNDTTLANKNPEQVLDILLSKINQSLQNIKAEKGKLAVTVEFKDGMKIQLLPAIKVDKGFKIPSSDGKTWSEINPEGFTRHLTQVNQAQEGKVIPAIKIIKSINSQFSEKNQMTGYHIESLAIEAFKSYNEAKIAKDLIKHFFEKAKDLVMIPIVDKTGQSLHVDDYLGLKNSESRKAISYQLDVVFRKIKTADNTNSIDLWKEVVGEV